MAEPTLASEAGTTGVLINESPRPRVLIRWDGDEAVGDEIERGLLELVPTVRQVERLRSVRQAEWDVLVTNETLRARTGQYVYDDAAEDHLCVVYCGKSRSTDVVESFDGGVSQIDFGSRSISQEILRVKGLPDHLADLVHEQLEPIVMSREAHPVFRASFLSSRNPPIRMPVLDRIAPFIATADGVVLAGKYDRSDTSECWLLPPDVPDVVPWVRAALKAWHDLAPQRFPGIPDWSTDPRWMTQGEQDVAAEIKNLAARRQVALNEFAAEEARLKAAFAAVSQAAESYERALLTSQSEHLVRAVIRALGEIGFVVVDADATADPSEHLEDLRISDPDAPNWIALGEVKGYTKGAKTEGITQFIRFSTRYAKEAGRGPDSMWYIVNQFMKRDPAERQRVLHGNDGDVSAFADNGGLVLDTVQLFHLLNHVRTGKISAEEGRRRLRESVGLFSLELA